MTPETSSEQQTAAMRTDRSLDNAIAAEWQALGALRDRLIPLFVEKVARVVRKTVPDATTVILEPTDQGGDGWVLKHVEIAGGMTVDDSFLDELGDNDELVIMFYDYGFWEPSYDMHETRLELPPKKEGTR